MNRNIYNEKEIPFKELERMLPDMKFPKKAIARLLKGRLSPLMKLDVESKGRRYSVPAKIALARENGEVCVRIFPIRKEIDNVLSLSESELERVKNNETIRITRDGEDLFVQIDPETKTLMSAKAGDIRIPHSIGDVTVGETQREQMRDGNPVQIEVGGEKVTVGVDLNDSTGFKVVNGDLNEWKEKKLTERDRAAPVVTGYWNTPEERTVGDNPVSAAGLTESGMECFMRSLRDKDDLFSGDLDLLPGPLLNLYGQYETRMEEYHSAKASGVKMPPDEWKLMETGIQDAKKFFCDALEEAVAGYKEERDLNRGSGFRR